MAETSPAALHIVQALQSLRTTIRNSGRTVSKSFDTVANSMDEIQQMFQISKMFKANNARIRTNFFKQTPALLKTLNLNLEKFTETAGVAPAAAAAESLQFEKKSYESELFEDLTNELSKIGKSFTGVQSSLSDLTSLKLAPQTKTEINALESDLGNLQSEMVSIMNSISSAGNVTGGAADEVDKLSGSLSDVIRQFTLLSRGAEVNSDQYREIVRQITDANNRLNRTRIDLGNVNTGLSDSSDNLDTASDGIKEGVDALVLLSALDLFRGVDATGATDSIASLNDELIEFSKLSGLSNKDLKIWRRSAIDTAKALNAMGVAADPAEVVDLYTAIRKTGIEGTADIKRLAVTIKQLSDATEIGKERAAEFAKVVIVDWGGSEKTVKGLSSAFIKMQQISGVSVDKIMGDTRSLGKIFHTTMMRLGKDGKETFGVKLAAGATAFKSIGLESTTLIENMKLALEDPLEAGKKFGHILQGTGYDVIQMAKDIRKGDPSKAFAAMVKGASKYRGMTEHQLGAIAETFGISVDEMVALSERGSEFIDMYTSSATEGMKEFQNGAKALGKTSKLESDKIGNLFERVGKRIKTWIADKATLALSGFGVELLEVAPKLAPILIVSDKLGFKMHFLGKSFKKAGMAALGYVGQLLGISTASATTTAATGTATVATTTFGTAFSAAIWPITLTVAALVGLWAVLKYGPALMDKLAKKFPSMEKSFMWIKNIILDVKNAFISLWKFSEPVITGIGKVIGQSFIAVFKTAWGITKVLFKSFLLGFRIIAKLLKYTLMPIWNAMFGGKATEEGKKNLKSVGDWLTKVGKVIKWAGDVALDFFNGISKVLDLALNDFDAFFEFIVVGIADFSKRVWEGIKILGGLIVKGIIWIGKKSWEGFKTIPGRVGKAFSGIGTVIWNALSAIPEMFGRAFDIILEKIFSLKDTIGGVLKSIPGLGKIFSLFGGGEEKMPTVNRVGMGYSPQSLAGNITPYGEKIIVPEPTQKIFAGPPETVFKPRTDIELHQEDVVKAIKDLTNIIKTGQTTNKQQQQRRPVRSDDQQIPLAQQWSL